MKMTSKPRDFAIQTIGSEALSYTTFSMRVEICCQAVPNFSSFSPILFVIYWASAISDRCIGRLPSSCRRRAPKRLGHPAGNALSLGSVAAVTCRIALTGKVSTARVSIVTCSMGVGWNRAENRLAVALGARHDGCFHPVPEATSV